MCKLRMATVVSWMAVLCWMGTGMAASLGAQARPDLVIDSLDMNDQCQLSVTLKNIDNGTVDRGVTVTIKFRILHSGHAPHNVSRDYLMTSDFGPNQTRTLAFGSDHFPGESRVICDVDPLERILESNDQNNHAERNFRCPQESSQSPPLDPTALRAAAKKYRVQMVKLPDLVIAGIHATDPSRHIGQLITVYTVVRNIGTLPSSPCMLEMLCHRGKRLRGQVQALNPGQEVQLRFTFRWAAGDSKKCEVWVDVDGQVVESNENNNHRIYRSIPVK